MSKSKKHDKNRREARALGLKRSPNARKGSKSKAPA